MAITKIEVISLAIQLLGEEAINAVDTTVPIQNTAQNFYAQEKTAAIAANPWRFASKIGALSKLVPTPLDPAWAYIYQLPADWLATNGTYPRDQSIQIYSNHLYANQDNLYLDYRYNVDEAYCPVLFGRYVSAKIASLLAITRLRNPDLATTLEELALSWLNDAEYTEGSSVPSSIIVDNPYVDARY